MFIVFELFERIYKKRAHNNLPLILPQNSTSRTLSALKFSAEGVSEFFGRSKELDALQQFINSSSELQWWIISGVGGSGKSRLALEICRQYIEKGFTAGFYDKDISQASLHKWNPIQPHLVIIDYAAKDEDLVRSLLKFAIQLKKNNKLKHNIRILLIERDAAGVLDFIKNTKSVGFEILDYLYKDNPLLLAKPSKESLLKVVKALCKFFKVPSKKWGNVERLTLNSPSDRKYLIAGLYSLSHKNSETESDTVELLPLIEDLIQYEKEIHWKKHGVIGENEDYLIVATMADGFQVKNIEHFGKKAKEFAEQFDFHKAYAQVVGENAITNLAPLSHDLISELYVLSSFDYDRESDRVKFHKLLQICLDAGKIAGVINFFTRASNDWSGHPTLKLLLPRFGQSEGELTAWLILMSNIIDKIDIPLKEKLDIFYKTAIGLFQENFDIFQKLYLIFESFYIRILNESTTLNLLDEWVGEYSVISHERTSLQETAHENSGNPSNTNLIAPVQIAPNVNISPENYCDAIIESFKSVDSDLQPLLIWHGLLNTYYHKLLHILVNDKTNLERLRTTIIDASQSFSGNWSLNQMFRDVIAGLMQFGHINKNKEQALNIVQLILDDCTNRENPGNLSSLFAAISSIYGISGKAYESRISLFTKWNNYYPTLEDYNPGVARDYLQFSVQLMSGFRTEQHADYALNHLKSIFTLTQKYSSAENIMSASLALFQMLRANQHINENQHHNILNESQNFAYQYSQTNPKIAESFVRELVTLYSQTLRLENIHSKEYFNMVIDYCRYCVNQNIQGINIYLGGILGEALSFGINSEDNNLTQTICQISNELASNSIIDQSGLWPIISDTFNKYNQLVNQDYNANQLHSYYAFAVYWLGNLNDQRFEQLFDYIIQDYEGRFNCH